MSAEPRFEWPPGFEPAAARLYVRNTRTIAAPAERIWSWLIAAPLWHSWYPNATNVRIVRGDATLALGSRFRWSQTGIALESDVRECVPLRRLAWYAHSPFIAAYHAWDIQPDVNGCAIVTDETQRGLMPALLGPLLRPRMLAIHDLWLERLERVSLQGFAPVS